MGTGHEDADTSATDHGGEASAIEDSAAPSRRVGLKHLAAVVTMLVVVAVVATVVVTSNGGSQRSDEDTADEGRQWEYDAEHVAAIEAALPGWEVIDEPNDLEPPLALSDEPVWREPEDSPLQVITEAELRGGDAILLGGDSVDPARRLEVIDLDEGRSRWGIDRNDELAYEDRPLQWSGSLDPVVAGQGGGWAVLVEVRCPDDAYDCGDEDGTLSPGEFGVAALSPDDGHVLWTGSMPAAQADYLPTTLVADDDMAVMTLDPPWCPLPQEPLVSVALNATDGSTLWVADGLEAVEVAGDTVIAEPRSVRAEGTCDREDEEDVVALDAATGIVRWDLRERFGWSKLILTAGDVALVEAGDSRDSDHEMLVLDLADGSEVASFGSSVGDCASDGQTLIACFVGVPDNPGALATFDVERRSGGAALTSEIISGLDTLAYERVFAEGTGTSESPDQQISVDRGVNVVDTELPGALLTASDQYAIFACGGPDVDCSGYELTNEDDDAWHPYYTIYSIDD